VRRLGRDGNAPLDGGPADGDVLESLLYEGDNFVAARVGLDEVGIIFIELQQAIAEGRELEVEILFRYRFGRTAAIRTRIAGLGFADVQLIEDAVLAGVAALVNDSRS
jgi:hypothetical protein